MRSSWKASHHCCDVALSHLLCGLEDRRPNLSITQFACSMGFILLLVFSLLLDVSSAVDSHSAALVAVEPEPCETGECHDTTSSGKSLDIATEPFADPDALPFVATGFTLVVYATTHD